MAIELKIPAVGESVSEVQIGQWLKKEGDSVARDENVVTIESEKATMELPAPQAGTISQILKQAGEDAAVGDVIAYIEEGGGETKARDKAKDKAQSKETRKGAAPEAASKEKESQSAPAGSKESGRIKAESKPSRQKKEEEAEEEGETPEPRVMPAAQRALDEHGLRAEDVEASGPGGRLLKEDVLRHVDRSRQEETPASKQESAPAEVVGPSGHPGREEEVVPMSPLRRTVARRLVEAQQTMAMLTTFNEIDMSSVMALRKEHQETFQAKYEVKLGFMSFFIKAAIDALKRFPQVNAEIRGEKIVYHNYYDIGVAIGGGKGLVVPVLRNAERMSFAEIERTINDFAHRAKENRIKLDELQGGTFTISNGGVYGSLLSTPIVNPPQSGILGMHTIQDRPVAVEGQVVVRPMMYVALSYDHRIVDGREAVSFLRRIKEVIEKPTRMLMEV